MLSQQKPKKIRRGHRTGYFVNPVSDEERFGSKKLSAIIYVRVSSEGQVTQGHGLESQEMVCREWCKRQNELEIEVVKIFREEGVSGKYMDRKAMNDAIHFLEKENKKYTKIHYFVVTDADRIARPDDIAEAFNLEQTIEALGVKIVTVNNKRDTETDEGKFLHTIQYAVAGLERRKILRRIMNGKLSRLKNGGRPFPAPPLGYIREKSPDGKESMDYIDPIKWPIVKEGLELYAYSPEFTKSQLYKFWLEKSLHTAKSAWKLYISFIEKIFRDYRLYFLAGYVYYPERGVDVPIKWNQQALVSLEVVERILEKEQSRTKRKKSPNIDQGLETHPLKGFITCFSCKRKLGCYASRGKLGKQYWYYTCGNKYCEERFNIPKEEMEQSFEIFLDTMKIPEKNFILLKGQLLEWWEDHLKEKKSSIPHMQWEIVSIQNRMKKIEDKLLFVSKEALIKKMEDEWSALETLEKDLQHRILNKNEKNEDILTLISNVEPLFTKPIEMWRDHDYAIRQLLFGVRFGHVLFYKKNQGYRTPNKLVLNSIFMQNKTVNTPVSEHGGINSNPRNISKVNLEAIFEFLISQSKYIMTIHKLKEIHWKS